jgi:hypothetical protein
MYLVVALGALGYCSSLKLRPALVSPILIPERVEVLFSRDSDNTVIVRCSKVKIILTKSFLGDQACHYAVTGDSPILIVLRNPRGNNRNRWPRATLFVLSLEPRVSFLQSMLASENISIPAGPEGGAFSVIRKININHRPLTYQQGTRLYDGSDDERPLVIEPLILNSNSGRASSNGGRDKLWILFPNLGKGIGRNTVLPDNREARYASDENAYAREDNRPYLTARKWLAPPILLMVVGSGGVFWGLFFSYIHRHSLSWRLTLGLAGLLGGLFVFLWGVNIIFAHTFNISPRSEDTVPQKYLLTSFNYWGTVIGIGRADMPNVLSTDKQVAVISALAEGSGIRQIERITGVHRDTIMRLGVRIGKGCANVLDAKMRNLYCNHLQFDEVWGFIGKKERHCTPDDSPEMGDVWTFCAIDQDTKIVPSFKVGKRDAASCRNRRY